MAAAHAVVERNLPSFDILDLPRHPVTRIWRVPLPLFPLSAMQLSGQILTVSTVNEILSPPKPTLARHP